jgi:hypothetical protein
MNDTFVDILGKVREFPDTLEELVEGILETTNFDILDLKDFYGKGFIVIDWDRENYMYLADEDYAKILYIQQWNLSLEDTAAHGAYPLDY